MKKILFIIYIFSAFLFVNAQNKDIDNFEFYFIKMNYSFKNTTEVLKKLSKEFEIKNGCLNNEFTVQPKNFIYPNKENARRDFAVTFYNDRILYFEKTNIIKQYKDYLTKLLGKYHKKEEIGSFRNYIWSINNYKITLQFSKKDKNDKKSSTLIVENEEVYTLYQVDYKKKYPSINDVKKKR